MGNHLYPQVRINKNGVAVTRHVKEALPSSAALRSFPPPATATSIISDSRSHTERLEKVLGDISTSAGTDYFHACISDPKDDSLLIVLENVSSGLTPEDKSLRKALRAIVTMATPDLVERNLRAAAVLRGSISAEIMIRFIAGMDSSAVTREHADRLNEAPLDVQEKACILAGAVSELYAAGSHGYNNGKKKFYITEPKLEEAILVAPARTLEYADFCNQRGSAESLDEIDSVQPAVRSGLL